MATPRTPNQKKRYTALNKRLARYAALVQAVYDSLAQEAASIVVNSTNYSQGANKPFRFKDYPQTKGRVDNLMRLFSRDISSLIYAGTSEEWKQSNIAQDLLANDVLKTYGVKHGRERYKRYYQTNNDALKAFQKRKDDGFSVSQKIWNQTYNFKRELEYAISSGIEKGQSAITLSKRISKYLHDFPSLQADYKERYGKATDCKDCEYRSMTLARSEINMAYRTAEQTRWRQMDFIKGYRIKLSHSHKKQDECDVLQGDYPKWFDWKGWHPNCFCICIPIIMTDNEWYSGKGKIINEFPYNFVQFCRENRNRINESVSRGTEPYWVKYNLKAVEQASEPYVMTKEDSLALSEKGFNVIVRSYNESAMKGFDLLTFDNEIESILGSNGITIEDCYIRRNDDNSQSLYYFGTSANGEVFELNRIFVENRGKTTVIHDMMRIPESLQGKGMSKMLFRPMLKQYLCMDADMVELYANMEVGGYAWARYGFNAFSRDEVLMAIKSSEANDEIKALAKEYLNRFYTSNPKDFPFPMNLLASQSYGKELLLNTGWNGHLNLKDKKQVRRLMHYIGL